MRTTWLLGHMAHEDFAYGAYRMVRTAEDRWCVRCASAEVTICGRAIDTTMAKAVEVYTTCHDCGSTLATTGGAFAVPLTIAVDASRTYWRYRNAAARENARILEEEHA